MASPPERSLTWSRPSTRTAGSPSLRSAGSASLDTEVAAFRDPSLAERPFRYVLLDATYRKARVDHRGVSQAIVVATGVAPEPTLLAGDTLTIHSPSEPPSSTAANFSTN